MWILSRGVFGLRFYFRKLPLARVAWWVGPSRLPVKARTPVSSQSKGSKWKERAALRNAGNGLELAERMWRVQVPEAPQLPEWCYLLTENIGGKTPGEGETYWFSDDLHQMIKWSVSRARSGLKDPDLAVTVTLVTTGTWSCPNFERKKDQGGKEWNLTEYGMVVRAVGVDDTKD